MRCINKRQSLFWIGIIGFIIGFLLIGGAIGCIFDKTETGACISIGVRTGAVIGVGVGFTISSFVLFKTYKNLFLFNKESINYTYQEQSNHLQQLKQLLDKKILTQKEFDEQKSKILKK